MSALPEKRHTVEEYFAIEGVSEVKHEYLDGQVYAMSGGHPNHNTILGNVFASFHAQLKKRPCRPFTSDQRVEVSQAGLYAYPDITVVCGEPEYSAHGFSVLNPTLLVEVFSPSTEDFDRRGKFRRYQTIPLLQQYVLIPQNKPAIDVYTRNAHNKWEFSFVQGLNATMTLDAISCILILADVYDLVTFDPPLSEA